MEPTWEDDQFVSTFTLHHSDKWAIFFHVKGIVYVMTKEFATLAQAIDYLRDVTIEGKVRDWDFRQVQ